MFFRTLSIIFLAQQGETWMVHMKYFLAHEIMHSLGLPHSTGSRESIMSEKPTSENDHKFKNVFRQFDSDELFEVDRYDLVKLFIESSDRVDWLDRGSSVRKDWTKLMADKHPECDNWNAKAVTFNTFDTLEKPTSKKITKDNPFWLTAAPTTHPTPTSVSFTNY